VLLRLGRATVETTRRPLVIAVIPHHWDDDPVAAVKQAHGLGADLVEVGGAHLDDATASALSDLGLAWMVATGDGTEARRAADGGAGAIRWTGTSPAPDLSGCPGADPWIIDGGRGRTEAQADGTLVPVGEGWAVIDDLHRQGRPVIVDLGTEQDRATLAAAVTVGLAHGAQGFRTVAPRPVRRAAFVIRAVELAG
jgi:hypothetical protein